MNTETFDPAKIPNDDTKLRELSAEKACEILEGIKFKTVGDEIEAVNAVSAYIRTSVEEIERLKAELERKDEALRECICTLQWHLNKSKPYEDADQSDFFNLTANSIIKGEEAINLTKK